MQILVSGRGLIKSNLYNFHSFYKNYLGIFRTVSGKSSPLLSWSHYVILLQVKNKKVELELPEGAAMCLELLQKVLCLGGLRILDVDL